MFAAWTDVDLLTAITYDWEHGQEVAVRIEPPATGDSPCTRMTIEHRGLPDDHMSAIVTDGWSNSVQQILVALT